MSVADSGDRWIRCFTPPRDGAIRLVCLPHAGGSASFYFPFARELEARFDVLAVQYPGRQDRRVERCIDDIGKLADGVFSALRPWLDRPLALFGHSMGATLGFEVARRIEVGSGAGILRLFASGRRAPSAVRDEGVHELDDDGVLAELTRLSGTDSRILGDEEIMRFAMPAIRADYKAVESYRLQEQARLRCPITVLTGDADPKVTMDEARAWESHTEAPLDLHVFDGGHFFLIQHQRRIAELVTQQLSGSALSVPD